jgi:uncharacterized protein YjbI with pentapeptide repeats
MDQISITNLYICLFHVYSGAYLNARFKAHNLASVGYAANRLIPTLLIFSLMSSAGNAAMESVDLRIVPANEILSKIKIGGDVNYDDVIINDDINTSQIKGVIHSSIRITNSEILGNIDFSNAKIKDIFDFDGTDFSGDFNFEKTEFEGEVSFQAAKFHKNSSFRKAKFNKSADFLAADFNGITDFSQTLFSGNEAIFKRSKFKGKTSFYMAKFDTLSTTFENAEFFKPTTFLSSEFSGNTYLAMSIFMELADFRYVKLKKDTDFSGTRFDEKLDFTGLRFTSLKLSWESIADKLICNGPTYLALIKNFKEMEQIEDADNCYVQYRDWKRETRLWGWPLLMDYLAWLSCGYGVKWHQAVMSGILTIVFFGIYFEKYNIAKFFYNSVVKRKTESIRMEELKRCLKMSTWLSAVILLSLPAEWYPYGKAEYTRLVAVHLYSSIIERLIGWSLMLLLIGTLSRLMVRY